MNTTPARIRFKEHLGQANHFLVTSLVALHTLEVSDVETAPEVLRTSWNPKNKTASIVRSRNFVMQSFLGWAVDSVDMYITTLDRKPNCLQCETLSKSLQDIKNSRSVSKRLRIISTHYSLKPETIALIDILITWRNNIFHEANDNKVQPQTKVSLKKYAQNISETYKGLDANGLPDKAEAGEQLTFKETASLINAAHCMVQELDDKVLASLNMRKYCTDAVRDALTERMQTTGFRAKYFGLDTLRRKSFVATWLRNKYGITSLLPEVLESACSLSSESTKETS